MQPGVSLLGLFAWGGLHAVAGRCAGSAHAVKRCVSLVGLKCIMFAGAHWVDMSGSQLIHPPMLVAAGCGRLVETVMCFGGAASTWAGVVSKLLPRKSCKGVQVSSNMHIDTAVDSHSAVSNGEQCVLGSRWRMHPWGFGELHDVFETRPNMG